MRYQIVILFLLLFPCALSAQEKPLDGIRVVVFISPVCPICQYYALPLRELHAEFASLGATFEGLVPNRLFPTLEDSNFKEKYEIPFDVRPDLEGLQYQINATITPEVFVMDSLQHVIYSGRIDNSYAALGKKRRHVNSHELHDVLTQLSRGITPPVTHQPAVGCLIQQ